MESDIPTAGDAGVQVEVDEWARTFTQAGVAVDQKGVALVPLTAQEEEAEANRPARGKRISGFNSTERRNYLKSLFFKTTDVCVISHPSCFGAHELGSLEVLLTRLDANSSLSGAKELLTLVDDEAMSAKVFPFTFQDTSQKR